MIYNNYEYEELTKRNTEVLLTLRREGFYQLDLSKEEDRRYFNFIKNNPHVNVIYDFNEGKKVILTIEEKYVNLKEKTNMKTMKNIVNLTPHEINIVVGDEKISVKPSGNVARVVECIVENGEIWGIAWSRIEHLRVEGLPEPEEGTIYIVSSLVAQALKGKREDVYFPAYLIRDERGNVIGCSALGKY